MNVMLFPVKWTVSVQTKCKVICSKGDTKGSKITYFDSNTNRSL